MSGNGAPPAAQITGANRRDVTPLVPLVDAVPPVRGTRGRPRRRPGRAYGPKRHRRELRRRGIRPQAARPGQPRGSGRGTERWVVERTVGWAHPNRRVRYDRRAGIHRALLTLACIKVCGSALFDGYC